MTYKVYVDNVEIATSQVEFDDAGMDLGDVPSFSFTTPNVNGMGYAAVRDGAEVKIYRHNELRFRGIVEKRTPRRREQTLQVEGRNKWYLKLMKSVAEYYRVYNGRYAPVINPWQFGRKIEEDRAAMTDGLRPDEIFKALIGTRFYYQEFFENDDAIWAKANVLIDGGIMQLAPDATTGYAESVPLHSGPDTLQQMGKVKSANVRIEGIRKKGEPRVRLSRDGGASWFPVPDLTWGGTAWTGTCTFKGALSVTSSAQEVQLPGAVYVKGDFTLAGYVKMRAFDANARLLAFYNPTIPDPFYEDLVALGVNAFGAIVVTIQNAAGSIDTYVTPETIALNTQTHICATLEGSTLTVYIDGENVQTFNVTALPRNVTRTFARMGQLKNADFTEVRVHSRALNQYEVGLIKQSEGVVTDALEGYWKMNDGLGSTAMDASGFGRNGTLSGFYANDETQSCLEKYGSQKLHAGGIVALSQRFRVGSIAVLRAGKPLYVRLSKVGNPTGQVVVGVGELNQTPTQNTVDSQTTLDAGLFRDVPVSFATDVTFQPNTDYVITVAYAGGDASNYVEWATTNNTNDVYASGSLYNGASDLGVDANFHISLPAEAWTQATIQDFESGEATTGAAISFDGSGASIVAHKDALNGNVTAGFSISMLFRDDTNAADNVVIIEKDGVWKLTYDFGYFTLSVMEGTSTGEGDAEEWSDVGWVEVVKSQTPITDRDFHHVVVTFSPTYTGIGPSNASNIYIDNQLNVAYQGFLNGPHRWEKESQLKFGEAVVSMDDLLIYTRRLNEDEIETINKNEAVITDGMVMELLFEESEGNVAHDTSGSGNNATLTGQTWFLSRSRDNISDPIRNHVAWRIDLTQPNFITYVKLDCVTETDTGIAEGSIDVYDHPFDLGSDVIAVNLSGQNRLNAMEQVRRMTVTKDAAISPSWDAWIDVEGYFHFKEQRGQEWDRTYSFENMNLLDLEKRMDSDITNVAIAKGAGSEPYAITIVGDLLKDRESIATYGPRYGTFTDSNIDDVETLGNRALSWLKLNAWPREEVDATIVNDFDLPWRTGDSIQMEDTETDTVGTFRVTKMRYEWSGQETVKIELRNAAATFGGVLRAISEGIRAQKNVAPGSVSQSNASGIAARMGKDQEGNIVAAENVIVLSEPLSVKRIFLALRTEAFDSFATGLEAVIDAHTHEFPHTHQIPGVAHSHQIDPQTTNTDASPTTRDLSANFSDSETIMNGNNYSFTALRGGSSTYFPTTGGEGGFILQVKIYALEDVNWHALIFSSGDPSIIATEIGSFGDLAEQYFIYHLPASYAGHSLAVWVFNDGANAGGILGANVTVTTALWKIGQHSHTIDDTTTENKTPNTTTTTNQNTTTSAAGGGSHVHAMKFGIYRLKDGTGVIYPTNLAVYVGDDNLASNVHLTDLGTFGNEDASVEFTKLDISNAQNPDGSFVFRNGDGSFREGIYKVYVKPTGPTTRNPDMLGKVVINTVIERQTVG